MVTLNEETSKPQVFVRVNGYDGLREIQEALIDVITHACSDHDEMNCPEFPTTIYRTAEILKAALSGNDRGFVIDLYEMEELEDYQQALRKIIIHATSSDSERNAINFPMTIYYVSDVLKSCLLNGEQLADYAKMGRAYKPHPKEYEHTN